MGCKMKKKIAIVERGVGIMAQFSWFGAPTCRIWPLRWGIGMRWTGSIVLLKSTASLVCIMWSLSIHLSASCTMVMVPEVGIMAQFSWFGAPTCRFWPLRLSMAWFEQARLHFWKAHRHPCTNSPLTLALFFLRIPGILVGFMGASCLWVLLLHIIIISLSISWYCAIRSSIPYGRGSCSAEESSAL